MEVTLPEKSLTSGEKITVEGQLNDALHILLEGTVELIKTNDTGKEVKIDWLGPGSLVGLISFCTGEEALTTARASTDCTLIKIEDDHFNQLASEHHEVSSLFLQLVIGNMLDRYQHMIKVHLELDGMNTKVEKERNHLQKALNQLEETQHQLVHREKMATLGQLVAGVAHELNNPASSLIRSNENLLLTLRALFEKDIEIPRIVALDFFEAGTKSSFNDTNSQRLQIKEISQMFPEVKRQLHRRMSYVPKELWGQLKPNLPDDEKSREKWLLKATEFFESGWFLHVSHTSTERISEIVKSLKNFSRQDRSDFQDVNILDGLNDTLLLLNNRLKKVSLTLELEELPHITCIPGEINQVWTNIIINACEAMENGESELQIKSGVIDDNYVFVTFADNGPGIPEKFKNRIFNADFTTKTQGGDFGLGIGLAITRDIVLKHGGNIMVEDSDSGGAQFTVYLPYTKRNRKNTAAKKQKDVTH